VTTTVFLVRHGSTDHLGHRISGRMDGVALNGAGREEAQRAALRLAGERLEALYTSPIQRTQETARAISAATGLEPQVDEALLEIDFGDWTGAEFGALDGDADWRAWNETRASARTPGGESMGEVLARWRGFLEATRRRHPDARVAAVSHGDVIKTVVADVMGFSIDRHMAFEISPGSVSTLVAGDWGMKMLSINEVPR
jgi:probable phosphoglycerate mutase